MPREKEKWVLLILLTLIWGSSFILIKKSLIYYYPYEVGSLRILIASILLMPYAILNIKKFPRKNLKWLIVAAFAGNFFPMFLFPLAETGISSSIAGIVNSMVPIFVIVLTFIFWKHESNKRQIIGVSTSFAGVCILTFGSEKFGDLHIIPIILLLLATLLYAINALTVKKNLSQLQPSLLSAFVFGIILFFPSLIALTAAGFFKDFHGTNDQWLGLGYVSMLAIFGTAIAMMLNYRLLHISNAVFAASVTLIMPIVAVLWGILDGEKITLGQAIGGVLILGGLFFLRSIPKK